MKAWHKLMADGPTAEPVLIPTVKAVTVKAVADAFLADAVTRCKPESMCVYRSAVNRLVKRFGKRAADTLKPFEVEGFANRPGVSASTRNTFLSAVVTAFRWAVRAGMLIVNPLQGVRKPPCGSRGASAVLTADEYTRLAAAAAPAFRLFLAGLWATGCRPGELARLTAADVDLGAEVAVLADHKTAGKTGRPRIIFLSPEAASLFARQAAVHPPGPLFPNKLGRPFTRFTMQNAMEAARGKTGLPHAICYGMRHSYATHALAAGVPDAHVAALLGHTSTSMLHRHYSHLGSRADVLRAAAARVRG